MAASNEHCLNAFFISYTGSLGAIDWDKASLLFERAPLGRQKCDPEKLKRAFGSSYAVAVACDSDRLVGMGRALCDGEYQAAIYDVAVLPEYQEWV